jgi:hypothetical protein
MKAFPSLYVHFNKTTEMSEPRLVANSHDGMDLRDYFAAKAMAKMNWVNVELSAQEAYRVADAMMKAREQ